MDTANQRFREINKSIQ